MWAFSFLGQATRAAHWFGIYANNLDKIDIGPDVDVKTGLGFEGFIGDSYQSSAPGSGALAGTSAWDAYYGSTPSWD